MLKNLERTIIVITLHLCLSHLSFAQIERNNFLLGASGYFKFGEIVTNSSDKGFSFDLKPKLGFFIINNLALGLSTDISYSNYGEGAYVNKNYSLGPFLRYYLKYKKNALHLELAYNYGKTTVNFRINNFPEPNQISWYAEKAKFTKYLVGLGYSYFIKENTSLEAIYQYQFIGEQYFNSFGQQYLKKKNANNINIGLIFYF